MPTLPPSVQGLRLYETMTTALRRHGGNITKAAEDVGMYRQNFQQKMRELGIKTADE